MRTLLVLLLSTVFAYADGEPAGKFDYYVMSLSWSPTFCALEGDARDNPQCDDEQNLGWVLHGLWPQYETGWPSYCRSPQRNPSRAQTAAMADIMGSSGSAWHQWKKHGICTGLSADDFYALARAAYAKITRPAVFRKLDKPVTLPASVIEQAFMKANPGLQADMVTITCKASRIQEARFCLTRDLQPRTCGPDVIRDCSLKDALFDPVR
jgi:ribonuclease T2